MADVQPKEARPIWIAAAIILAAIVLFSAVQVYSYFGTTSTTTSTAGSSTMVTLGGSSATASSIDCNSAGGTGAFAVPSGSGLPFVVGNSSYQCERILVIPPGSTGMLAVGYRTDVNAVSPQAEVANFTAQVLAPVYSRAVPISLPQQILGYTNASGVTITPSIPSLNVTAVGNESLTVTYTISVSSGTDGLFELQYLDECPTLVPLAVGYDVEQLNVSSFPDYQPFLQTCTQLGMLQGGNLLSVSGIQMAWMVQSIQRGSGVAQDLSALQLRLSLNATSITAGQSVSISVEEYNTLPEVNNVTAADQWPVQYLTTSACGALNSPVGFAVLSGHYTSSNVSAANPLDIYEPGIYNCPSILSGVKSYAFLPMGSMDNIYGPCNPEPCFGFDTNASSAVRGSWGTSILGSAQFSTLSPGIYTVVAGTEWGDSVLAYFTVHLGAIGLLQQPLIEEMPFFLGR